MRKGLLTVALSGALLLTTLLNAQNTDRSVYAMTDVTYQNGNWVHLRGFSLDKGVYTGSFLNGTAEKVIAYDAISKKPITDLGVNKMGFNEQPAFNSGVAALAYDSKHGRIYYTPMFIDQLRYYDIKSQKVFYFTSPLTNKPIKSSDQGSNITRMTFASDGNGYAMTNDATQLIRFTTGKKAEIVDLGTIADDQANKNISIHNSCSSFGGDMVADDNGNLIVFTARNNVFSVNINSRVATYVGAINGLPNGFTVNGAAVTGDNEVLVASATETTSLFTVDMKTLTATAFNVNGTVWHTSDLASANVLASGNKSKVTSVDLIADGNEIGDNRISIYPNPVLNNQFTVQFAKVPVGTYTLAVTDMMGRQLMQQVVTIGSENQTQSVKLNSSVAKGMYLVKVTDPANKAVFSTKIVLQ